MKRTYHHTIDTLIALHTIALMTMLMLWCMPITSHGQNNGYFIQLRDKNESPYSLSNPESYLSARAIERRLRQQIEIDQYDLPVNPAYINGVEACGVKVKHSSKWLNGLIVFCDDENILEDIKALPYIVSIEKTKEAVNGRYSIIKNMESTISTNKNSSTETQLEILNGNFMHQYGYTGQGIHIAVLDAGFLDVDNAMAFDRLFAENRMLGVKDFVDDDTPFFQTDNHGLHVLSILAGQIENQFTGSAPQASYYLFRTEDRLTEYPVEADYWVCAAELADSIGVDIIQSSLGYYYFDNPAMNYSPTQLNVSTRISKAATIAVSKGMVVVNSAGNEALNPWQYIIMPADSPDVLTVGAIDNSGIRSPFSSVGYAPYSLIKPDVMALGVNTSIVISGNHIGTGNGTSFACPLVSGLAACLWQAAPDKTAREIIQSIRQSASQWQTPDYLTGYGIPNFRKALKLSTPNSTVEFDPWKIHPNPFNNHFILSCPGLNSHITLTISSIGGARIWKRTFAPSSEINVVPDIKIPQGIYILSIETNNFAASRKLYKR